MNGPPLDMPVSPDSTRYQMYLAEPSIGAGSQLYQVGMNGACLVYFYVLIRCINVEVKNTLSSGGCLDNSSLVPDNSWNKYCCIIYLTNFVFHGMLFKNEEAIDSRRALFCFVRK